MTGCVIDFPQTSQATAEVKIEIVIGISCAYEGEPET